MGRYNANTGLGEFYYAVLSETTNGDLTIGDIKVVDYVQEMSLEFGEELEKAYGSNKVAKLLNRRRNSRNIQIPQTSY